MMSLRTHSITILTSSKEYLADRLNATSLLTQNTA